MNVGGTARYVGKLVADLPIESLLATGFVQGGEIEDPILSHLPTTRVPHLGRKISPLNDLRAYLELRRVVRDFQPDLIHSHTFKAGLIARLLPRRYKKVHTFHGHLFDDQSFSPLAKLFITRVERLLAKRTDLLISVGEGVGEELRARGIGSAKAWISIKPGVDPLPSHKKSESRKTLGLPDGLIFGWMARVTSVKNPMLFLEIVRALPQFHFAMAGGGDLLDQVGASAPENLQVLGWSDASLFWSAVDIAISTSDNEGMPIALIEAQLAGLPVIASDVGSSAEVVSHGLTGLVVEKSAPALISACRELALDPQLLVEMSKAARVRAIAEFSTASMLQAQLASYRGLTLP